ncbi:MAG: fumarylacetoacetate hydrolase family protein [Alphaproteobacteria bacterium]
MKLASLRQGGRDGTLVVASRDLRRAVAVPEVARTLQAALDDWHEVAPELASIYRLLNQEEQPAAFDLDPRALAAPLPRAYQFLDGSAYLAHMERVRRARGAGMPENAETDPLMYQGCSDSLLGPCDPIVAASEDWGIDFEAEVAVITDDVPMGVSAEEARAHIKLLLILNDVSLRRLIPSELAKGFGFVHGKPPSACSPVAVSPEELGAAWDGARLHLPLRVALNGETFGAPDAGADMAFDFPALIAHAAKTRPLGAGTIVGAGTVANADAARGYCCLLERRSVETAEAGEAKTPFLAFGDRVSIDMRDARGGPLFGAIEQEVVRCEAAA